MRYQISGKQIDIGEALQTHVRDDLGSVVQKYAERPTNAQVIFSKSAHEYVCEATVHLSTGLTAQAKAHATEIYAAFDACSEKMEKQLRRYKRRLKDHHKERAQPVELSGASSYILASEIYVLQRVAVRTRQLQYATGTTSRHSLCSTLTVVLVLYKGDFCCGGPAPGGVAPCALRYL